MAWFSKDEHVFHRMRRGYRNPDRGNSMSRGTGQEIMSSVLLLNSLLWFEHGCKEDITMDEGGLLEFNAKEIGRL